MDLGKCLSPFFFHARKFSTVFDLPVASIHGMLILHFDGEGFKVQKLLIADSSDVFSSALAHALGDRFDICICADGPSALDHLQQDRPDILILNLMLPYKDGISVLQESNYHPPVILAITMHLSAYVEQAVTALGIDYTMIAPAVDTVVMRLEDLARQHCAPSDSVDLSSRTIHHLHQLNIPTHLDGYHQLCIALPLFAQNPQQFLTKELYPAVAKLCGSKDSRAVEHSIRKAIQAAWKLRDNALWRKYFTPGPRGHIPCPTSKEFLCRLTEILRAEIGLP